MRGSRSAPVACLVLVAGASAAAAQSPFGVGLPDPGGAGLLPWVAALQQGFYRDLTAALAELKRSGLAFPWLAGISLAYGVVHAAGPGHGKVVIASYLLATRETVRRGILLAFLSAMLQAFVAVAIVSVMAVVLNMTSMAMTGTARVLEVGSYALVLALGLYLLARKVRQLRAGGHGHHHHHHDHHHGHHHHAGEHHHHGPGGHTGCAGHAPVVPASGAGSLAAVLSVGLRPCSGALIVLVFALAQGIFWAGIASTFLMSFGTAVTVAALAALAVGAKGFAGRIAGGAESRRGAQLLLGLELVGAFLVTALGAVLLGGALLA